MKIIFLLYSFCAGKPYDFILMTSFITVVSFQEPQPWESCCLQILSFSWSIFLQLLVIITEKEKKNIKIFQLKIEKKKN